MTASGAVTAADPYSKLRPNRYGIAIAIVVVILVTLVVNIVALLLVHSVSTEARLTA